MNRSRVLFSALLVMLSLVAFSQAKTVPPFNFQRLDNGKPFTEADLTKGKKLMFLFFDAECSHCQDAVSIYNKEEKKLNDAAIYMITKNTATSAAEFLKRYAPSLSKKKNVTILYDGSNQFIARFLPKKYPSMFLYDKNRKLVIYSDEEKDIATIINKSKG